MKKLPYLLLLFLSVLSCRSIQEVQHEKHHHFLQKTDTIFIEKTRALSDTLFIQVPVIQTIDKKCDTLCQEEMQRLLAKLHTKSHQQGTQKGIYYDALKKQLVLYTQLQEEFSLYKSQHTNNLQVSDKQKIKEVPVSYVPLWAKIFSGIGAIALIYAIIRLSLYFFLKK